MMEQSGYSDKDMNSCAKDLISILNFAHTKKHYQAVFKKFARETYLGVSTYCQSLANTCEAGEKSA